MKPYRDEDFIRGRYEDGMVIPMSKEDVRLLTLARLGIEDGDRILDIGSGTGTLTCEAARRAGEVISIEREARAAKLTRENAERLGHKNVTVLTGRAGEVLDTLEGKFDGVLIGGSGGELETIVSFLKTHLASSGRVVANFITLENLMEAKELLSPVLEEMRIRQVGITRLEPVGKYTLFRAENPVFILSGEKKCSS